MKAHGRVYKQLNINPSTLWDWPASGSGHFTPANKTTLTHRTGGCKGPRPGVASFKITFPVAAATVTYPSHSTHHTTLADW
jgi:hypothetical protein